VVIEACVAPFLLLKRRATDPLISQRAQFLREPFLIREQRDSPLIRFLDLANQRPQSVQRPPEVARH